MTDRELLELAAKAAEIECRWLDNDFIDSYAASDGMWLDGKRGPDNSAFWNPLTDDGDALRLAVKLKLFLDLEHCNAADSNQCAPVWFSGGEDENAGVSHDECDPHEATRRAIVRAAAEIGKNL